MAKLRKFSSYQSLERPYTRISKFSAKNFVRGGFPALKITKFDMGNARKKYDTVVQLISLRSMNIRHNALESARMSSNRLLEGQIANAYHLRVKVYPFHVLRENPLAAGAGADRMSTGMQKSYGKVMGAAARVKAGQTVIEVKTDKQNLRLAKQALGVAATKIPCPCKIVAF